MRTACYWENNLNSGTGSNGAGFRFHPKKESLKDK